MIYSIVIVLALFAALAASHAHIPERARRGELFKQYLANYGLNKNLKASTPFTWQAPVDHFDPLNNATFAQR